MSPAEHDAITGEIAAVRAEAVSAKRKADKGWYFWLVLVMTAVAGPGIAIGISVHNQHASEAKLCAVVTTANEAYRDTPPTTPAGIRQAANMEKLRDDLHCDRKESSP